MSLTDTIMALAAVALLLGFAVPIWHDYTDRRRHALARIINRKSEPRFASGSTPWTK
jgi:hypothetical protein